MSAKSGKPKKRASTAGTPYRGGPAGASASAPSDTGLVGDLIRQFADPFAFYRELVQNAIDAGTTSIHVQLVWEPGAAGETGVVRVSVRDDGSGMTREVLEQDLTVLFRSTKESRDDAIGKFGIGFVSVLALSPEVVIVDTSVGDGVRWSLHLHPDQTYDLFRADTSAGRGTTVTLVIPLPDGDHAAFAEHSEAALRRWCRHARLPIRFVALAAEGGEPLRDVRIDEPMTLDAIVSVQARSREGSTTVVAGLPRAGARYGAFFNQGLLLHETRDHELGEVAFKVSDPRLEHTLSRDDVRRDENYARALSLVARTLRGPLLDEAMQRLHQLADAFARGSTDAAPRLLELIDALERSDLPAPDHAFVLPAVPGAAGRLLVPAPELRDALVSREGRTPLAEALARAGHTVVDLSFAKTSADADRLSAALARRGTPLSGRAVESWSLLVPEPAREHDARLLEQVAARLAEVVRRPSEIVIAEVHGAGVSRLSFAASGRSEPWLSPSSELRSDPFRLLLRPPLVLNASHPIVGAARERAGSEPVLASTLLARAILVAQDVLTPARDAELTERALRDALDARGAR